MLCVLPPPSLPAIPVTVVIGGCQVWSFGDMLTLPRPGEEEAVKGPPFGSPREAEVSKQKKNQEEETQIDGLC